MTVKNDLTVELSAEVEEARNIEEQKKRPRNQEAQHQHIERIRCLGEVGINKPHPDHAEAEHTADRGDRAGGVFAHTRQV